MKTATLCIAVLLTGCVCHKRAAEDSWLSPPKGSLTITNLEPKPSAKSVKKDSFEVHRDGQRVAYVNQIDSDKDGGWEEFVFSAFVAKQRVVALMRIGGTNESAMFFSFDDVMVMTDVRIPEVDLVALVVTSKKHDYYEIFARKPEGYYWPADDKQREVVDAMLGVGAQMMSPIVEKLKR